MSLNDQILTWGAAFGFTDYDSAKRALVGGRTQEEIAGSTSWNEGMLRAAGSGWLLGDFKYTEGYGNANDQGACVFLGGDLYINNVSLDGKDASDAMAALPIGGTITLNTGWEFTVATKSNNTTHWQFGGTATGTPPASEATTTVIIGGV